MSARALALALAVLVLGAIRSVYTSCEPQPTHKEATADADSHLPHARARSRKSRRLPYSPLAADDADDDAAAAGAAADAESLLALHTHWDWKSIVNDLLQPWPAISKRQLDAAVATCNASAMYCSRMQVIDGSLHLTDYAAIFFDRHYAPSRILPLLETLRRHPDLPNVDLVVAANDEPRVPCEPGSQRQWTRLCSRYPGNRRLPPVIFSSTVDRAALDLPWVDFAFFFPTRPHKLRTAPWSRLHGMLLEAGRGVEWGSKIELAMHTGNVGSTWRKRLANVASANPGEVLVNELFIGDHRKIQSTCEELNLHRAGGFQQHKCFMRFEQQCKYKYLLNSASIGYANKLKSLLLCGSVVIYVREGMRHREFYELGLVAGVHYVAVDTAADVPAMVRWLRRHDDYAKAVARAGRARMSSLDVGAVTDFLAELLRQYAARLVFKPRAPQLGGVRIECEDDLWRHYALSRAWAQDFLTEDNASCVHPPRGALEPPGWGGAYAGSKVRCYASHDLSPAAQPGACNFSSPFSTAESWAPEGSFPYAHPSNRERWGEA